MAEVTKITTVEFTEVIKGSGAMNGVNEFRQWLEKELTKSYLGFDNIKVANIQLFVFPDNKPKLSKRERMFCEFMKCGWIARDKEKNLYWYNSKPYKNETTWNNNNSEYICMDLLNTPFAFIQWEDDVPWDVSDLLKLEVEE